METASSKAGTLFNVVDAVTGATRSQHGAVACTWDGINFQGYNVEDGEYRVFLELTDYNGTGYVSSFSFTKDGSSEELKPEDKPSFSNIVLNWTLDADVLSGGETAVFCI